MSEAEHGGREWRFYLDDMIDFAGKVQTYTQGMSQSGTGTSARIALMAERGEIKKGQWLKTLSPRDSSFVGTLLGQAGVDGRRAWDSRITGRAWTLTRSRVSIELDDPLVDPTGLENILANGK